MFSFRIVMMAIRSLRQNLMRSILATLGVIIGVGAVVSAVSILEGAQRDVLQRFETLGADQVLVFNGSDSHSHRRTQTVSLLPKDAEAVAEDSPDLIVATSPQYNGGGQIKYYERNAYCSILGATASYGEINNYFVEHGRFLTREDVRGKSMVAVLGHTVAEDLFGARSGVGKSVKINGKTFIVVGIMEEKGALGFLEVDKQVIIPLSTAMGRMFGSRYLSMLVLQCASAEQVPTCIERIKKSLRATHRIKAGDSDDFIVFTQDQFKQQLSNVAKIFAVVLYSIAGISLLVGAIGIMNIMLVSVTERTREIGVRMAVGARRFDILRQFLTEASVISFIGGGLGVICGWAIANFLGEYTQVLEAYTPPISIVIALVMATVVGVVSGIYPAVRAARLDPVLALRYE
ncbi:MAG: ABC transporter permease [Planctomycetes bacterium]|nr:ABC transporter permease [Planctomycetota bacterium]